MSFTCMCEELLGGALTEFCMRTKFRHHSTNSSLFSNQSKKPVLEAEGPHKAPKFSVQCNISSVGLKASIQTNVFFEFLLDTNVLSLVTLELSPVLEAIAILINVLGKSQFNSAS